MPFVHIRIGGPKLSAPQIAALQEGATRLMADVLRKKAELTAVLVEEHGVGGWSVGDAPVPSAAHLEATVTAGTNGADEKAAFIQAAHALLRTTLEQDLPLATYVVVAEIDGESWGYGGLTQAARAGRGVTNSV